MRRPFQVLCRGATSTAAAGLASCIATCALEPCHSAMRAVHAPVCGFLAVIASVTSWAHSSPVLLRAVETTNPPPQSCRCGCCSMAESDRQTPGAACRQRSAAGSLQTQLSPCQTPRFHRAAPEGAHFDVLCRDLHCAEAGVKPNSCGGIWWHLKPQSRVRARCTEWTAVNAMDTVEEILSAHARADADRCVRGIRGCRERSRVLGGQRA